MENFKTGKELGLKPIKLNTKGSTKELDDLHKEINETLYFYYMFKINPLTQLHLLDTVTGIGETVGKIVWPKDKGERRNELLKVLREYYKALKQYNPPTDKQEVEENDKRVSGFLVSSYLKEKKQALWNIEADEDEFFIGWLKKLRIFCRTYTPSKTLISVYEEIIDRLKYKP